MVVNVAGFGIRDKGFHGQIVKSVVLLAIVCQFLCIEECLLLSVAFVEITS